MRGWKRLGKCNWRAARQAGKEVKPRKQTSSKPASKRQANFKQKLKQTGKQTDKQNQSLSLTLILKLSLHFRNQKMREEDQV